MTGEKIIANIVPAVMLTTAPRNDRPATTANPPVMIEPGLSAKPKMIANMSNHPTVRFSVRDRFYAELLHPFRLMVATADPFLEFAQRCGALRQDLVMALMVSVPLALRGLRRKKRALLMRYALASGNRALTVFSIEPVW